ncbi:MAG TPA: hypothetical protein PK122_06760 [Candidatus Paceibacterota bacterium]|nr:hypothetical protein [Candidatus Paceibacterota bacterium]
MNKLKNNFIKNGLKYKILERIEDFVLLEVRGQYGGIIGYEVGPVIIIKRRNIGFSVLEKRESILPNSRFGYKVNGVQSSCFFPERSFQEAKNFFDNLVFSVRFLNETLK